MDTYLVNVQSILDDLGATIEVSDDIAMDQLVVGDDVFTLQAPAHFDLSLTNTGTGVIGMGRVAAQVVGECARCLCEFPFEIAGEIDGLYIEHGREEGIPEDQEFEYIDADGVIDVLPAVMSVLVLEAPFAPIHDEECAGLCPECGADLNEGPCGCDGQVRADNPFAALGALLSDEDDADEG